MHKNIIRHRKFCSVESFIFLFNEFDLIKCLGATFKVCLHCAGRGVSEKNEGKTAISCDVCSVHARRRATTDTLPSWLRSIFMCFFGGITLGCGKQHFVFLFAEPVSKISMSAEMLLNAPVTRLQEAATDCSLPLLSLAAEDGG